MNAAISNELRDLEIVGLRIEELTVTSNQHKPKKTISIEAWVLIAERLFRDQNHAQGGKYI
jgi:hypothetical protein